MLNLKMVYFRNFFVLLIISLFVGCSSSPVKRPQPKAVTPKVNSESKTETKPGGYYLDDGPGDNPPADIDSIPSATLKTEQPNARANKPYAALGQQYTPMTTYVPYKKQGIASWYGKRFHGKNTSTGEVYDMYSMTAAHTILPIPSYAKVTNPANGRSVIVRINDRGPFKHDRLIDLSYAAAFQLRLIKDGSGLVELETIDTSPEALQKMAANKPSTPTPLPEITNTKPVITPIDNSVSSSTSPRINTSSMQYFVQAGAFKNETNGDLLMKRIEGLNLVENVGVANVYNNGLYRVKLGPFSSRDEADVSAANIRKQLNIAAHVTN
jgi:rare lipoprotein A